MTYQGFLIKQISYKLQHFPENKKHNIRMHSTLKVHQGNVNVEIKNKPLVRISIKADANNLIEEEKIQTLKLSIDFLFNLDQPVDRTNSEEFKKLAEDYALSFCFTKLEDVIKQITSIDYGRPILIRNIPFPSDVHLMKKYDL